MPIENNQQVSADKKRERLNLSGYAPFHERRRTDEAASNRPITRDFYLGKYDVTCGSGFTPISQQPEVGAKATNVKLKGVRRILLSSVCYFL